MLLFSQTRKVCSVLFTSVHVLVLPLDAGHIGATGRV